MRRLFLRCGLSLVLTSLFLANVSRAAEPPVGAPEILARFTGVWRTQGELRPTDAQNPGAKFTVNEVTQPILKGRYILGRENSEPDNRKSLWLMTWDAQKKVAPFIMFDSQGLLGGQWELTWDDATKTAVGGATDLPPGWTSRGANRFVGDDTNVVDYWIKDADGKAVVDAHAEKKRQPDESRTAALAAWSKSTPSPDRPAELDKLAPLLGTWDAETVVRPAIWTPKEMKTTSTVVRRWVLHDRILFDRSIHATGDESIALLSFDPGKKEFCSWWFNSEGHRNTSRGGWSDDTRTFSFQTDADDGKVTRSTIRLIAPDRHEWQIKTTDAAGAVYYDATIVTTKGDEKQ